MLREQYTKVPDERRTIHRLTIHVETAKLAEADPRSKWDARSRDLLGYFSS